MLTEPTSVTEVAERVDCTVADVRPHLEWFVERGVLDKTVDDPPCFVRNEAYFEFRRVTELTREFETPEAVADAIEDYRERERELAASFEAGDLKMIPSSESDAEDDSIENRREWLTVTRRLRELRRAKQRLAAESTSSRR